jgi:hypothetical protein
LEPNALQHAFEFTCLGARPSVVAAILQGYRSTEVIAICREYAAQQGITLPKGPLAADDARATLATVTRRMHLSGAISLYARATSAGVSEPEALRHSYNAYKNRLAWHLRKTDQFVGFERFYVTVRSFVEARLRLQMCLKCKAQFLISENPGVRRDCPFCHYLARGMFSAQLHSNAPATGHGRLRRVINAV